jgi:hypothetical protein
MAAKTPDKPESSMGMNLFAIFALLTAGAFVYDKFRPQPDAKKSRFHAAYERPAHFGQPDPAFDAQFPSQGVRSMVRLKGGPDGECEMVNVHMINPRFTPEVGQSWSQVAQEIAAIKYGESSSYGECPKLVVRIDDLVGDGTMGPSYRRFEFTLPGLELVEEKETFE